MSCEYCRGTGFHDCRCPNYILPKTNHYCSICEEGIYNGDEYVVNKNNDSAHYDCVTDLQYREMIQWLGCEVKTMEEDYGEDY